jgi:serine/threonine-protein kinase PknK
VKAARGDRETAAARLAEGARIAAERRLVRLAAHVRAEQLRLAPVIDAGGSATDSGPRSLRHLEGTAALSAEAEEFAAIRALLARHYASGGYDSMFGAVSAPLDGCDSAVKRARALHSHVAEQRRPRAQLDAAILLAECLSAAGWTGESIAALTPVVVRCAELGWTRPLLDAGPGVLSLLHAMRTEMLMGTEHSEMTDSTHRFLNSLP